MLTLLLPTNFTLIKRAESEERFSVQENMFERSCYLSRCFKFFHHSELSTLFSVSIFMQVWPQMQEQNWSFLYHPY